MGLSSLFGGKDDAVTAWRKELLAAVKGGDVEHLKFLLKRDIEAPPEVLDEVLAKTVKQNQLKMTRSILAAGGRRTLDTGVLQQVVYGGHTDMYRLLTDHGWDFSRYVPAENGSTYIRQEKFMAKDYEADRLRAELEAVKKELSGLKKTRGIDDSLSSSASPGAAPGITDDTPPSKKFVP